MKLKGRGWTEIQNGGWERVGRTNGGDGGDDLPQFQLVEDGGLPRRVQPHHQDAHLLLPDQAFQQVPEYVAHGDWRKLGLFECVDLGGDWWKVLGWAVLEVWVNTGRWRRGKEEQFIIARVLPFHKTGLEMPVKRA